MTMRCRGNAGKAIRSNTDAMDANDIKVEAVPTAQECHQRRILLSIENACQLSVGGATIRNADKIRREQGRREHAFNEMDQRCIQLN